MHLNFRWKKPWFVSMAEEIAIRVLRKVESKCEKQFSDWEKSPHDVHVRRINHWAKCTFRYPNGTNLRIYLLWDGGSVHSIPDTRDVEDSENNYEWDAYLIDVTFWPTEKRDGSKERLIIRGKELHEYIFPGQPAFSSDGTDDNARARVAITLAHISGGGRDLPGVTLDQLWSVVSRDWYLWVI